MLSIFPFDVWEALGSDSVSPVSSEVSLLI